MVVILCLLPIIAVLFARLLYLGLKRTYHTQRIALPGLLIWFGFMFAGIGVVALLLFFFGFGIARLFW